MQYMSVGSGWTEDPAVKPWLSAFVLYHSCFNNPEWFHLYLFSPLSCLSFFTSFYLSSLPSSLPLSFLPLLSSFPLSFSHYLRSLFQDFLKLFGSHGHLSCAPCTSPITPWLPREHISWILIRVQVSKVKEDNILFSFSRLFFSSSVSLFLPLFLSLSSVNIY